MLAAGVTRAGRGAVIDKERGRLSQSRRQSIDGRNRRGALGRYPSRSVPAPTAVPAAAAKQQNEN